MNDSILPSKLLIFIVAYNAESTLHSVLHRIPDFIFKQFDTTVLVIDDASQDKTFEVGVFEAESWEKCKIEVLVNEYNLGYGGNQKLGYEYAIQKNFHYVVLLHGDGQYAPEMLPSIVAPLHAGDADAVFGSRMLEPGDALRGGMPLYKYWGNRVLSVFQNTVLEGGLSEYHSGYRAYAVECLKAIPFRYNSNDFHFDTEIIIQILQWEGRIKEIAIPTYYGDEICHVNGMVYAANVINATIQSRMHEIGILYQRKFDIREAEEDEYTLKENYLSSHTKAIGKIAPGSRVLDVGCGSGQVAKLLNKKGCSIRGVDKRAPECLDVFEHFYQIDLDNDEIPEDAYDVDVVLLLDIVEHLKNPEGFIQRMRERLDGRVPKIIVTTPNIAFFITRFALFAGQFNYGKRGILDMTHTRLFTFSSLKKVFQQSGYRVKHICGIPAPFPKAFPKSRWAKKMLDVNVGMISVWKSLFAYQIYCEIEPMPTVSALLRHSNVYSEKRAGSFKKGAKGD